MVKKFYIFIFSVLIFFSINLCGQDEGVKSPVYNDYKNDTSFKDFSHLRYKVACTQINLLKKGALLVRLKTNSRAISKIQSSGNIELAKKLKKEIDFSNRIIMSAYKKEFTFCPVYFFYSESSDSVRKSNLTGIFVDSNLLVNSNILCNATFFLIAEQGDLYNSSLGLVPESMAPKAIEAGSITRDAAIVVKNKYFIQLHKPFPYFQIKGSKLTTHEVDEEFTKTLNAYRKVSRDLADYKRMKGYRGIVAAFNDNLDIFYENNIGCEVTALIKDYIY